MSPNTTVHGYRQYTDCTISMFIKLLTIETNNTFWPDNRKLIKGIILCKYIGQMSKNI